MQATPFGGWVTELAQAPSAPRILYAAAQNSRIFRSLDGGATWHRRAARVGDDEVILDLAVDPGNVRTLYARTAYPKLYRSRDGGATWSQIGPDLGYGPTAVALDRDHPGVVFAATTTGLHRSDDGGDSWVLAAFENTAVAGVAIDPHATDTIFVTIDGASFEEPSTVWKSTDRGVTWTSVIRPTPSGYDPGYAHFVFDPVRPDTLYLFFGLEYSYRSLVLRSTDGGTSWSPLPLEFGVNDLAVLPNGTLFIATDSGLGHSDDGGATWVPTLVPGDPAGPPHDHFVRILASPAAPGELIAAGSAGIWTSHDQGASWATSSRGLLAQAAWQVAVAPTGPPAVFSLAGVSVFRSADQGDTWTRLHSLLEGPQPYVIEAFDPAHPGTIYGIDTDGQSGFPVVSTDGGSRWSKLQIPYNCDNRDSLCDVTLATVALDHDGTLLAAGSYYFHFQGRGNFLLRSTDGGQTWNDRGPIPGILDLVVDPQRRGTLHAVSCEGVFRSRNAGDTWRQVGRGLPARLCPPTQSGAALAIDPQDPQRLYLGTLSLGIFASSDGGATFSAMNRGLEQASVATLLVDPADSSKLYAGVAQQGVFRWNAERRRWTPLSQGLPAASFGGSIELDPRHPSTLYAATTAGVFRLDLDDSAP